MLNLPGSPAGAIFMRVVRDHHHQGLCPAGSAVTVGNFDGLHRGHAALVEGARSLALDEKLAVAVMTFEPLSREYFARERVARIYSAGERLRVLQRLGPDLVWLVRFNAALASMSPEAFVRRFLVEGLAARYVIVGDDFRFGHRAAGDVALLRELGGVHGFEVRNAETVMVDGARASSTRVREALLAGDFGQAERLLGRPYAIDGRVVRGRQLGQELGYPTANIRLRRRHAPLHGVYAVRVDGPGFEDRIGVASLGVRPTVDEDGAVLLEVHLFDYAGDLYGAHLSVRFVAKLREEERFDSLDALVEQMNRDAELARELLAA